MSRACLVEYRLMLNVLNFAVEGEETIFWNEWGEPTAGKLRLRPRNLDSSWCGFRQFSAAAGLCVTAQTLDPAGATQEPAVDFAAKGASYGIQSKGLQCRDRAVGVAHTGLLSA